MKVRNQLPQRTGKFKAALMAATMGGLLASGTSAATGYPVVDIAHIKAQVIEFGQQAARWGEQGRQWTKEYQQFMQQYNSFLSSINTMQTNFSLAPGSQMQEVDENTYMVEERCGPQYGTGSSAIFGRLTGIDMRGDIHQQRWQLCASLQVARNKQYNEVVRYLNETAPRMQAELNQAGQQFVGSGKTQGDMSAYAAKMEKVKGDMAQSNEEFQARMQGYDAFAKGVETAQGSLTRGSLRGSAGLIKQVTNTAVMYEALCGSGKCD